MVEGVHFDWAFCSPEDVGYKLLSVNVSDLAAMNATPLYALVSLALPAAFSDETVLKFYEGLNQAAADYGCEIEGGTLARSAFGFTADLALLGESDQLILRSGLKVGDLIAVTSTLGEAALGLHVLKSKLPQELYPRSIHRYLRPRARLDESRRLAATGCVSALIDISDGLSSESLHLAQASQKKISLTQARLPLSQEEPNSLERALHGGGDYELLVGLDADRWTEALMEDLALKDVVHVIGEVTGDSPRGEVWLEGDQGPEELEARGWRHF